MEIDVHYNELLIEKGKLDPLGIWRVGDRLIGELLPPFTTVVSQRPARYFSMYCWILDQTIEKHGKDNKPQMFWRYFFELEAIFLCANHRHSQHNYSELSGRIGILHADRIIRGNKAGRPIIFAKIKIRNGWEANYKNPMFSFGLIKNDYGIAGNLTLTDKGKMLSDAYRKSISSTTFYGSYRNSTDIPLQTLDNLADKCCPCLIHSPKNKILTEERDITINVMFPIQVPEEGENYLHSSMMLFLRCMEQTQPPGSFVDYTFMRTMTSGLIDGTGKKFIPGEFDETYKKWRLYTIDSLFTFALESGLRGFLELLHMNNERLSVDGIASLFSARDLSNARKKVLKGIGIKNIDLLNLTELQRPITGKYENEIIENISSNESGPKEKIIYSYLLYSYCQELYGIFKSEDDFNEAVKFYNDRAYYDKNDISLLRTSDDIKGISDDYSIFCELFLKKWIIERQLSIRGQRVKEIAWFDKSVDGFYEWEHEYEPGLYRASRLRNLIYFLLSMNIVIHEDNEWRVNPEMKARLEW